jgi:hypothetical protein
LLNLDGVRRVDVQEQVDQERLGALDRLALDDRAGIDDLLVLLFGGEAGYRRLFRVLPVDIDADAL